MTRKEQAEHKRLLTKWATYTASRTEMLRCMDLTRKDNAERRTP